MDKTTIELIAVGASAAANCRPCMDYHVAAGKKLGISDDEIQQALEVGIHVNRGAGKKTVEYIRENFGKQLTDEQNNGCCR